jgi:Tol biopolymer transport system component
MGGLRRRIGALGLLALTAVATPVAAQNTTARVSVSSARGEGNRSSALPAVSADGRYVAFASDATNLVPLDTNNTNDVFVHDRQTGVTERVSLTDGDLQANGSSASPSISADGRFVAFESAATNLVTGDTNGKVDIFVRDRQTLTTTRVSVSSTGGQAANDSVTALIGTDGLSVAFTSLAENLVAGDTNGRADVFIHYRAGNQETLRVSVTALQVGGTPQQPDGSSFVTGMSGDGRFVVFESAATNIVSNDTNGRTDVFVRDLSSLLPRLSRVSLGAGGVEGNGASVGGTISDDGRFVAFSSEATNLAANGAPGVYVRDRQDGATTAVSTRSDPSLRPGAPTLSHDGRYVCFAQPAPSQASGGGLLLIDRVTLTRTRLDVSSNGDLANDTAYGRCTLSGDATIAAFASEATNLVPGDTNGAGDVFVRTMFATVAIDKTELTFGAVTSGSTFVSQTAAQRLRFTQSGVGTIAWKILSDQPWLRISPAFGTGSAELSISVVPAAGLPASGTVRASITILSPSAINNAPPISVVLTLTAGATARPFGTVDTPPDNRTGVTGAVPFTGWALDDLEVTRVSICRAAFGAEVAPVDPNCGGAAEIFVGVAVFIDGARPDVTAAYPSAPLASRAGWGFMVLTNMLPNQGNGTYRFTMRAEDREGQWSVLGTRTMTAANAQATLPFGTIDTPGQGETVSGTSFVNFGWALTPLPKTIFLDGSQIFIQIDGVNVERVDYNHPRADIQALFPGLNNTNGAVGFRVFDTTSLTNGLHTIQWVVTDDQGATEGLGSRFFTVSNGVGGGGSVDPPLTAGVQLEAVAPDTTPVAGRRGWDPKAPLGLFGAGASGVTVIRSEEVSRVELQLGDGDYTGYLRTAAGLAPLPIGSHIDRATNTFTWAPGVGFVGRYDLVFVRSLDGRRISRRDVRILLHPKGRGAVGPQVAIDVPRPSSTVGLPFMLGGWAADLDAPDGTGVTTVHAWAYPAAGGAPLFLGATVYGGARPDVAAVHGERFTDSGFGLIVQGLPTGDYDLALFAWSTETMGFVAPVTVRVTVKP